MYDRASSPLATEAPFLLVRISADQAGLWNKARHVSVYCTDQPRQSHEIDEVFTIDAPAGHGVGSRIRATAIGNSSGGWPDTGFAKGESHEFSSRAGERPRTMLFSANPYSRWIVSLLVRSCGRLS